jgi:hypothetical protein
LGFLTTHPTIVRFVRGDQQAFISAIAVKAASDVMTAAWKVSDIKRVQEELNLF